MVLLAHRSHTVATGIRNHLRELGYEDVIHVRTAGQALRQLEEREVDLLVVGWRLEEGVGIEIVKEVRERPASASLPVLMVSPHADRDRVMSAVLGGVDGYLLRPFTEEALAARVDQALARRRMAAA